ncbi:MAG: hypothetical protein AAFN59_03715 [Pseudomonadota bacterium]
MKRFWKLFALPPAYRVYTTQFDELRTGRELAEELTPQERVIWDEKVAAYIAATEAARTEASLKCLIAVDALLELRPELRDEMAASIVIDHSGSLRGQKAILACFVAELLADALSRLGITYEILGFTTRRWKGGRSRDAWNQNGRPLYPGRLSDRLHIIYRSASESAPGAPYAVRHILRDDLLKENIDGEALHWAGERLQDIGRPYSSIIMVSDGAPVDDSTLHENPADFLFAHLKAVIGDLEATPGTSIAGIGIDHDVSALYSKALKVDRLDDAGAQLPEFLEFLFN